jgi:hypothetical protein
MPLRLKVVVSSVLLLFLKRFKRIFSFWKESAARKQNAHLKSGFIDTKKGLMHAPTLPKR